MSKSFKSGTTSFHYFSPKASENLKSLDIGLREVAAKRPVNGVRKTKSEKTHRHMNKSTYRKHRSRGPMLSNMLAMMFSDF